MKKLSLLAGIALLIALPAKPDSILLSGDTGIGVGIGLTGNDNATFFKNVLGAGTNVLIQELDFGTASVGTTIAGYYNTLSGVTATETANTSVTDLTGVNLFISMLPQAAYSSAELAAMNAFVSGGGTLFLFAEGADYTPGGNSIPFLNAALSSLGSSLAFVAANDDPMEHHATGAQIASNPLTSGVNDLYYAYTSETTGGTPLFLTTTGATFVEGSTAGVGPVVPEPAALPVMLLGSAALLVFLRRRRAQA